VNLDEDAAAEGVQKGLQQRLSRNFGLTLPASEGRGISPRRPRGGTMQ